MTAHRTLQDSFKSNFVGEDPGDAGKIIPTKDRSVVPLVTAAAETRTLPDPDKAGLQLSLTLKTDGGNCVVTASTKVNMSGNTTLTFADAGDTVHLMSVHEGAGFRWAVLASDGAALS